MKAWHFLADSGLLRDGSTPPADGIALHFEGQPVLCERGLHASIRLIDALQYAPGSILCRVECEGTVLHQEDKLVCTQRTILWRKDVASILREFARKQALSVEHNYPGGYPPIVKQWLESGDESIKSAAKSAAWYAAESAAKYAAESAAKSAAKSAAESAAEYAAWSAAEYAAKSAAWYAAESAARSAAKSAARSAAESAAKSAARSAAEYAAKYAAWSAAWSAANTLLEDMVN